MKRRIILEVDDDAFLRAFDDSGQVEEGTGIAFLMMPEASRPVGINLIRMLEESGVIVVLDTESEGVQHEQR